MQHRIVIARHRPWLKWLLLAGGTFVLAVAAWTLYQLTRAATADEFEHTRSEVEALQADRRTLVRDLRVARAEVRRLKERVTYLKQSQTIDEQATQAVRESLAQLQAEAADLREQLAFYRGIAAPEQSRAGVRVHELKLVPTKDAGQLTYDLVLIQSANHEKRVAGKVEMALVGMRKGNEVTIPWAQFQASEKPAELGFSLRYFQEFSGLVRVSDEITPLRVVVTLVPQAAGAPKIEQAFEWGRLINAGG